MPKTAISLSDQLFHMMDECAKKQGLTQNELFVKALREYIRRHKGVEKNEMVRKINEVCEKVDTSPNPHAREAAKRILSGSEW